MKRKRSNIDLIVAFLIFSNFELCLDFEFEISKSLTLISKKTHDFGS